MNQSIWSEYHNRPQFLPLQNNIECEVLVIGGGMAGVLCAHFLKKQGKKVVLVEAKQIGDGATKNTTAVLSAQHDTMYADLIKMHGKETAKAYLEANIAAVHMFKELSQTIDCDFEQRPSYLYSITEDLSYEVRALQSLGFAAELAHDLQLPFAVKSAVKFPDMAQFHPLKFLYALAKDVTAYENTFVAKIKDHTALTSDGHTIQFQQAVVASHFPFINRAGLFFVKMFQKRSYVAAIEGVEDIGGTMIEDTDGGFYFRQYKNLLLVGKGDHRTGTDTAAFDQLNAFCSQYFPDKAVQYLWANQDCVTLDSMPYIGKYGYLKDVYTLTGFNLWGMTGSMVGATVLADTICAKQNPYADIFRTNRRILRLQLLKNLGEVLVNMLKPTIRRCPHLGCALTYNKREHTWDCACHGSRFADTGELIDNPATRPAKLVCPKDDPID